jgi:hypothetical protein
MATIESRFHKTDNAPANERSAPKLRLPSWRSPDGRAGALRVQMFRGTVV